MAIPNNIQLMIKDFYSSNRLKDKLAGNFFSFLNPVSMADKLVKIKTAYLAEGRETQIAILGAINQDLLYYSNLRSNLIVMNTLLVILWIAGFPTAYIINAIDYNENERITIGAIHTIMYGALSFTSLFTSNNYIANIKKLLDELSTCFANEHYSLYVMANVMP